MKAIPQKKRKISKKLNLFHTSITMIILVTEFQENMYWRFVLCIYVLELRKSSVFMGYLQLTSTYIALMAILQQLPESFRRAM